MKTIESITKELDEFEKEDIPKIMNKFQCENCGSISENLEIKKVDFLEQIKRFKEILNDDVIGYGGSMEKISRILNFTIRKAYVTCTICRFRKFFEINVKS